MIIYNNINVLKECPLLNSLLYGWAIQENELLPVKLMLPLPSCLKICQTSVDESENVLDESKNLLDECSYCLTCNFLLFKYLCQQFRLLIIEHRLNTCYFGFLYSTCFLVFSSKGFVEN